MKHPDFICIGAQKAGTTWLFRELRSHPRIRMPRIKELKFFPAGCLDLVRGSTMAPWHYYLTPWNWLLQARYRAYCNNFDPCAGYVTGELTPEYILSAVAAKRIHTLVPNVKLLAILRNPIDRAFSQWRMLRHDGQASAAEPFMDAFDRDLGLMRSRGHYVDHLHKYLRYFQLNANLRVLIYDDLCSDPATFVHQVYQYLEVEDFASPTVNERKETRYRDDGLKLSPADGERMRAYYKPHVEKLQDLLGRHLAWQ